jgi:hypothetical protein
MTTGRINQVTTSFQWPVPGKTFPDQGVFVHYLLWNRNLTEAFPASLVLAPTVKSMTQHALFLDLTKFQAHFALSLKRQGFMTFKEDYQ